MFEKIIIFLYELDTISFAFWDFVPIERVIYHWMIWHSWLSSSFGHVFNQQTLFQHIYIFILLISLWIIVDLILYWIWHICSKLLNIKSYKPKLYLLWFRFIPVIWYIWALIWWLSKKKQIKQDMKYILLWNILFWIINSFPFILLIVLGIIMDSFI